MLLDIFNETYAVIAVIITVSQSLKMLFVQKPI